MRRRVLIGLLALLLSPAVMAQGVATWLETSHDFGTFREQDGKVTCEMRLVNTGDSALVITRVRSSCGCTATDYTRAPLQPGDTGRVRLTYNPRLRPGEFSKDVFVYTTGSTARTTLVIKGNVIPCDDTLDDQYPDAVGSIRLNGTTLPLGEVTRPRGRMAYISGYNASTDTMVVTTSRAPRHITAQAVPDTVPPGAVTTITVHFDSKLAPLWGLNVDSLLVMAEPLGDNPTALSGFKQVDVMAQVREDFSRLTAEQLERAPQATFGCDLVRFSPVRRGDVAVQSFTIKNTGRDPLHVRRLWTASKGITASIDREQLKRGKSATVTVTVDTRLYREPLINAMLTVMTNDPAQPSCTMRLVGEIVETSSN